MKHRVAAGLLFTLSILPAVAVPAPHPSKPSVPKIVFPAASRLPLPLRRVLYMRFMEAIQKADDDAEKKYPTPLGYVKDHAQFDRFMVTRSAYVNKLTELYTGKIRRTYGVSSREEDLIENEGAQKEWPN